MMSIPDSERDPFSARGAALHFLIGALVLLAFAWGTTLGMNRSQVLIFPSDRVYADLALARNLLEQGFLGAGAERLPAQSDALWRLVLVLAAKAGVPWIAAPPVAAFVLSLAGLAAVIALVRAIDPRAAWSAWACVAWGVMLPVAQDAFGGWSASAAAACAALGIAAHARGLGSDRTPLPLSAAWWIGLAALFRIELLALWIALGLHTVILALLRRVPVGVFTALIRMVNGGVVAAILLCPVIWWNVKTLSVPWPAIPDAATTLNAVGGASIGGAFASGFGGAAVAVLGGGGWDSGLLRLFILGGIAWLVADLARGRVGVSATTLLIGALVPPAFALLHPFLGAEALPYLQRAVQPLWMLSAGYFVVRAVDAVSNLIRNKAPQLPAAAVVFIAMALIGAMPVLAGMRDQVSALRRQRVARADAHEARAALAARLGPPEERAGGIASDEPGWLMFQRYPDVVDLGGRFQPILLNWISGGSVRDEAGLREYLASRNVRAAVIWREPRDRYGRVFECPVAADSGPIVCRLNPTAIP